MTFEQLIAALPAAAKSWPALIAYLGATTAFVVVSLKVNRNKNLLAKIKSIPERDVAQVLQMEMGAAYLSAGLSPQQWLQQQRQRYYFVAFLVVCLLIAALLIAARFSKVIDPELQKQQAQETALQFLRLIDSGDLSTAYDLFPDDIKNNVKFAQFQSDMARMLFQQPRQALKHRLEQGSDSGGYYFFVFATEFGIDASFRTIVGFNKSTEVWRLWSYNFQPVEWPLYWPSTTQIQPTAAQAMKVYASLSAEDRSAAMPKALQGHITGASPGWKLIVDAGTSKEPLRCSVRAHEVDSATVVDLKRPLGGCNLKPGQRIIVNGMLSAVDSSRVELEGVRLFPE